MKLLTLLGSPLCHCGADEVSRSNLPAKIPNPNDEIPNNFKTQNASAQNF
jgi:hypothetical protein